MRHLINRAKQSNKLTNHSSNKPIKSRPDVLMLLIAVSSGLALSQNL